MKRDPKTEAKYDRWLVRAVSILEGKANGMGLPVLRMLAFRGHHGAMVELANRLTWPENSDCDFERGLALELRLAREVRESWVPENVATSLRNHGDMIGYRRWLARAARLGEPDVIAEKRRFETRFPYEVMKRWGRCRPLRRSER
jgi:hypothetical protein